MTREEVEGIVIRIHRDMLGLTQNELEKLSGVPDANIQAREKGAREGKLARKRGDRKRILRGLTKAWFELINGERTFVSLQKKSSHAHPRYQ